MTTVGTTVTVIENGQERVFLPGQTIPADLEARANAALRAGTAIVTFGEEREMCRDCGEAHVDPATCEGFIE